MFKLWKPSVVNLNLRRILEQIRLSSAWINRPRGDPNISTLDVEKLFIDDEVQKLLMDLTGMDLEGKVFRPRRTSIQQRSHFALMTDERLNKTLDRMRDEARHFLNFVPVKEPRPEQVVTLSKDTEISGFDSSKFIFTDITFDATDQDRTVVIREVDGTLRTATPEEHDRMNRIYYQKPNRPVFPPPLFRDPYLQDALDRDEHEFVLDWACWFYEPDDPSFIKLSQLVFDRIVEVGKFDVLHSTRHFGALVFYLALNDNISPLLNYMGGKGRIRDCANLVRLYKILHPDWRVAIGSGDNNEKIVKDYISQNKRFHGILKDLLAYLKEGRLKKKRESVELYPTEKCDSSDSKKATINATNVKGVNGPLGELSEKYVVNLEKPERNNENEYGKKRIRGRYSRRYQDKSDTIDEN